MAQGRDAILGEVQSRPPGAHDVQLRLKDLDDEGIWGEIVYPSIGLWNGMIKDPALYREGVRVLNDYLKETYLDVTPRSIPAAEISVRSVDDAVAEATRVAEMGFKAINLPTTLDEDGMHNWNYDVWEPLWATAEEAGLVLAIHIGSEAKDPARLAATGVFHGPGGAVLNYVETTFGGQRAATMLVTSGALDRHPDLKVLISEGGRHLGALHRRPHGRGLPPARRATCGPSCPARPARSSTSRSTPPSSTTSRPSWPTPPWATTTSCGAATTPTWKAPSGTPRRSCTSSSTTWTRPPATA